jgi:type I restriction enzyme, S subunit
MYEIKYRDENIMETIEENNIIFRPDNWKVKSLKYVSAINNGATPKTSIEEFWDGSIDWYTPIDFGNKNLCSSKRKITMKGLNSCGTTLVPKGSCIVTCRAPIGNVAILDNIEATHNQGCKSIVPKEIDFKFLYYTMLDQVTFLKSMGKGTTFMELSSTDLKNIKLLNPSIFEQNKITNFLDLKTAQFDQIISKKEQLIEKLKEVKKSLISEVVTGKVKIVDGQLVERDASEMKDSGVE